MSKSWLQCHIKFQEKEAGKVSWGKNSKCTLKGLRTEMGELMWCECLKLSLVAMGRQ